MSFAERRKAFLHLPTAFVAGRFYFLLLLLMATYVTVIMCLLAFRLNHYLDGFDLAFYQQATWNTLNGRFLEVSGTDFSRSLLGTDVLLIYALLAPFYALWQSPLMLLLVETVVVALGALPVFWLACERLQSQWAGLGMALLYLMLLSVQNGNLYELRERPFAMSFLLFAFYYYEKNRFWQFMVFSVLALMCRPENGLVLLMLALYGWLKHRQQEKSWRYIVSPALLGAIWFGVAVYLIIPANAAAGTIALGENFPGGSPQSALFSAITDPAKGLPALFPTDKVLTDKLLYIPCLLLPFLFLPLGSSTHLLMALPALALNLLSIRPTQWNAFDYHYQGSIVPWLIAATIFTLEKIKCNPRLTSLLKEKTVPLLLAIALLVTLAVNVAGPNKFKQLVKEQPQWADGKALLAQIPTDAPLAITNTWASLVPPRQGLWLFKRMTLYSMHPEKDAQYIFAWKRGDGGKEMDLVKEVLADPAWKIQAEQGEFLLLKRN
ncbi:DUF2079 domain-containing protein [Candidatus Chlorohelix sp.]|uniref:DUF2079 domain-containing protein n=1 Tax=Candidatus Chlorohelix sp. TaxID=3139201 RepID=UPI0030531697